MTIDTFRAGTQYGDFKGTAQADRHDSRDVNAYLEDKGLIHKGQFIVAVEFDVLDGMRQYVSMTVLVAAGTGYDNVAAEVASGNPLKVRRLRVDLDPSEFFALWKRFSISISSHGMLDGMEYEYDDADTDGT